MDALDYAVPFDDPAPTSEDTLLGMGFGPTTGVDAAMANPGMLAYGLALESEFNDEEDTDV